MEKNKTAVKLCIKFSVVCLGNNDHKCYVLYFNYVFVGTEWVSQLSRHMARKQDNLALTVGFYVRVAFRFVKVEQHVGNAQLGEAVSVNAICEATINHWALVCELCLLSPSISHQAG